MNDLKLYYIKNIGCDDETQGIAYMTDDDFELFQLIVKNLNKNSTCRCMPIIEVYRISEDMIREANDKDSKDSIMYLGAHRYVLIEQLYIYYKNVFDLNPKFERVV